MTDKKTVIKGLEICSAGKGNTPNDRDCTSCPYYPAGYTGCTCKPLMTDALALLKDLNKKLEETQRAYESALMLNTALFVREKDW